MEFSTEKKLFEIRFLTEGFLIRKSSRNRPSTEEMIARIIRDGAHQTLWVIKDYIILEKQLTTDYSTLERASSFRDYRILERGFLRDYNIFERGTHPRLQHTGEGTHYRGDLLEIRAHQTNIQRGDS